MQPGIRDESACNPFFNGPEPVRSFFAPGRINIIGEHLDYNGGYVFPSAISLGITGRVQYREDTNLLLRSEQEPGTVAADIESSADRLYDAKLGWANYPLGAIAYLGKNGLQPRRGMNIYFSSTLPKGSGLSSSAALEVITAFMAAGEHIRSESDRVHVARILQTMENEYIGVRCGIMDQFTVALGRRGHAILLNSDTMEYRYVPVDTGDYTFIIMNSNKPRRLFDSSYNERRAECEIALEQISEMKSSITCLAQAGPEDLEHIPDPTVRKRARHVITENRRVLKSVDALTGGNLPLFGRLLTESHASLRDDYEVTGPELDALVGAASVSPGCIGARMTGAGFGGCAIAFVKRDDITDFTRATGKQYTELTGLTVDFYESGLEDGARELE